jgi:hypothetical protein
MAERTKKSHNKFLADAVYRLSRKFPPYKILHELSVLYEEYAIGAQTEAEAEFWLKCSKACSNLSSGTDKWFAEMRDEIKDMEEEE